MAIDVSRDCCCVAVSCVKCTGFEYTPLNDVFLDGASISSRSFLSKECEPDEASGLTGLSIFGNAGCSRESLFLRRDLLSDKLLRDIQTYHLGLNFGVKYFRSSAALRFFK